MRCNVQVNTHHFWRLHQHLHPQDSTDNCRHNCTYTVKCGSTYAFVFDTSTTLTPATSTRCRGVQGGRTRGGTPASTTGTLSNMTPKVMCCATQANTDLLPTTTPAHSHVAAPVQLCSITHPPSLQLHLQDAVEGNKSERGVPLHQQQVPI